MSLDVRYVDFEDTIHTQRMLVSQLSSPSNSLWGRTKEFSFSALWFLFVFMCFMLGLVFFVSVSSDVWNYQHGAPVNDYTKFKTYLLFSNTTGNIFSFLKNLSMYVLVFLKNFFSFLGNLTQEDFKVNPKFNATIHTVDL